MTREIIPDSAEIKRLGGISQWLCVQREKLVRSESRSTVLGHIQHGGIPSGNDRVLCTRLGAAVVNALVAGEFGKMVAIHNDRIAYVPIEEVAGKNRKVDPGCDTVRAARDTGVSFGDD